MVCNRPWITKEHQMYGVVKNVPRDIFNMEPKKIVDMENFLFFIKQLTNPKWYELFTVDNINAGTAGKLPSVFRRVAFQQQYLLDVLLTVGHRFGHESHMPFIFNTWKHSLGLSNFTPSMCRALAKRLSSIVSVYVVPRQSGKT